MGYKWQSLIYHHEVIYNLLNKIFKNVVLKEFFLYLSTGRQSADLILEKAEQSLLCWLDCTNSSHDNPSLPVYCGSVVAYICSVLQVFKLHL